MRILKIALLASAIGFAAAVAANAADVENPVDSYPEYSSGLYVRGDLGWSFLEWGGGDDDSAFTAGGGLGYRFNDLMRTDVRIDWAGDYNVGKGDERSATTVLGNFYFDWTNETGFTPYVGAGVGYGWAGGKGSGNDDDGFAFALMTGLAVELSSNVTWDTGYRFRDVTVNGPDTQEHQVTTGIRFGF